MAGGNSAGGGLMPGGLLGIRGQGGILNALGLGDILPQTSNPFADVMQVPGSARPRGLAALLPDLFGGPQPEPKPDRTYPQAISSDELLPDARAIGHGSTGRAQPPRGEMTPVTHAERNAAQSVRGSNEIENYIIQSARRYGVDPDTALRVARAEGGTKLWNRQSDVVKNGKRERSYGPFQLYMDGGLGNKFKQETGMDPSDAAAGPAGIDFAMREAAKGGWTPWYGARAIGLQRWDGIKGGGTGGPLGKSARVTPYPHDDRAEAIESNRVARGMELNRGGLGVPAAPPIELPTEAPKPSPNPRRPGINFEPGMEYEEMVGPLTPAKRFAQEYKVNKTTRRLRGLGPAATIAAIAELGRGEGLPTVASNPQSPSPTARTPARDRRNV